MSITNKIKQLFKPEIEYQVQNLNGKTIFEQYTNGKYTGTVTIKTFPLEVVEHLQELAKNYKK